MEGHRRVAGRRHPLGQWLPPPARHLGQPVHLRPYDGPRYGAALHWDGGWVGSIPGVNETDTFLLDERLIV